MRVWVFLDMKFNNERVMYILKKWNWFEVITAAETWRRCIADEWETSLALAWITDVQNGTCTFAVLSWVSRSWIIVIVNISFLIRRMLLTTYHRLCRTVLPHLKGQYFELFSSNCTGQLQLSTGANMLVLPPEFYAASHKWKNTSLRMAVIFALQACLWSLL